jgi:hypothetical protein
MICPNCSQPISEGVKFCPECGSLVATAASQPSPTIDSKVERISREAATRAANAEARSRLSGTSHLKATNSGKPSVKKRGVLSLVVGAFIGVLIVCLGAIALLIYDANVSASRNGSKAGLLSSNDHNVAKTKERTVDPNGIYFRCIAHGYPNYPHEVDYYVISAQRGNFDYFSKFFSLSEGQLYPGLVYSYSWTINRTNDWNNVYTDDPRFDDASRNLHEDRTDATHSWYHWNGTELGITDPAFLRQYKWSNYPDSVMIDKDRLVLDTESTTDHLQCSMMSRTDAQQVVDKYWDDVDHQSSTSSSEPPPVSAALGSLHGMVCHHDCNYPVSGAKVELTSAGKVYSVAIADENGVYAFQQVPPGEYVVSLIGASDFTGYGYLNRTVHVASSQDTQAVAIYMWGAQ